MSAPWLADILADEFRGDRGFRVDAVGRWQSLSARTTFFSPEGVMNHHTGPGSYNALLNFMAYNASTAPLCNYATSRPASNVVRITAVAAGRANHAGVGELSWRRGQGSTGNAYSIGGEHQNDGRQAWPSQQLEAIYRSNAAILAHLGQGVSRLTDHKTYALPRGRKPDPHSLTLAAQRNVVGALLKARNTIPTPTPPPVVPTEEDDMFVRIDGGGTVYHVVGSVLFPLHKAEQAVLHLGTDWRPKVRNLTSDQVKDLDLTVVHKDVGPVLKRFVELTGSNGLTSVQGSVLTGLNAYLYLNDQHNAGLNINRRYDA